MPPTCQAPPDEKGEVCNTEGFSQSIEHENLWYCRKHYLKWLEEKPVREFTKILQLVQTNPEAKAMLQRVFKEVSK